MTTTGETLTSNLKAMITGYEELEAESEEKDQIVEIEPDLKA
jgi:thiosulfate reductase cytochrome b subunit